MGVRWAADHGGPDAGIDRVREIGVFCDPNGFTGKIIHLKLPKNIDKKDIILQSYGPIIGPSIAEHVNRIIYIVPEKYGRMAMSERYSVARLIGKITNRTDHYPTVMLIGPGRWGTKMPSLGIPVSFSEIKNVSVLCEIAKMHEGLTPDLSLGTHFFNDLVDMNILYMGISPEKTDAIVNEELLKTMPNKLPQIITEGEAYADTIYVIDTTDIHPNYSMLLYADTLEQEGIVFLSRK